MAMQCLRMSHKRASFCNGVSVVHMLAMGIFFLPSSCRTFFVMSRCDMTREYTARSMRLGLACTVSLDCSWGGAFAGEIPPFQWISFSWFCGRAGWARCISKDAFVAFCRLCLCLRLRPSLRCSSAKRIQPRASLS